MLTEKTGLVVLDGNPEMKKFIDKHNDEFTKILNKQQNVNTNSLRDKKAIEFIVWYINRNVNLAYKNAIHNSTHNQHTVPNFTNTSLGMNFAKPTTLTICDQPIKFKNTSSIKAEYDYENSIWKMSAITNSKISVFQNIYDINLSDSSLPDKFVECFLGAFENDAAQIINLIKSDKTHRLTFSERVILSCYAVLQNVRTENWDMNNKDAIDETTSIVLSMSPGKTEKEARDIVLSQFGLKTEDFGWTILGILSLETLSYFFHRRWKFFDAPSGLVTSLHPVAFFDEERWSMFTRGVLHPAHIMLPLDRNLLWVMAEPSARTLPIHSGDNVLTKGENKFVNEIFSLGSDTLFTHPEDAENIFPNLYRTDPLNYYCLQTSWEINDENDPYKLDDMNHLLRFIPKRFKTSIK